MAAEQQIKRATPRQGEPKFNPNESMEDNVYRMRNAGLIWGRVQALTGLKPYGPAQRAYRKACAERGEEPKDFRRKENRAPKPKDTPKKAAPQPTTAAKKPAPKPKAAAKKTAAKKPEVDA